MLPVIPSRRLSRLPAGLSPRRAHLTRHAHWRSRPGRRAAVLSTRGLRVPLELGAARACRPATTKAEARTTQCIGPTIDLCNNNNGYRLVMKENLKRIPGKRIPVTTSAGSRSCALACDSTPACTPAASATWNGPGRGYSCGALSWTA
jgi:hypothetical protein